MLRLSDRRVHIVALLVLAAVLGGCASATFIPTTQSYPPKPENCEMEVFTSKVPDRPYEEIGIIEGEGMLGKESLADVLPEMVKKACMAGGDALILISTERTTDVTGGDDFIGSSEELHTMGTVIVWIEE